jgi:hypothetical protein
LPLVKSPTMTPRKIAANQANAQKSTGPRTADGWRRAMLNRLRHGARSRAFRANLLKAGQKVELFDWIHKRLREEMPHASARVTECLARRVWCGLCLDRSTGQGPKNPPPTQASLWCAAWTPWRAGGLATKPRYTLTSMDARIAFLPPGSRIRIEDPNSRRRRMFWVRQRRGAKVRLPVTAWPEIAVWEMLQTSQLPAGEQRRSGHDIMPAARACAQHSEESARAELGPGAALRLLKG